jgi:hypothetical protein
MNEILSKLTFSIIFLMMLLLNVVGCVSQTKIFETANLNPGYVPIKWAEIVLGGFDYYKHPPGRNTIQKVEHWIQSRGIPYDVIDDDNIEAPTDKPSHGKYPLQYANGTIRYQVIVIVLNDLADSSAVNVNYIYWAVGNGTNAVIFGTAAKFVPELLNISPTDVSWFLDTKITKINCLIHKSYSDGIIEYQKGTNQTINLAWDDHSNIANTEGKTIWYTMHSDTGKNWNGMMNTTYGSGQVFWNSVLPSSTNFLRYSIFYEFWEDKNLKFIAHSINFMFKQVAKIYLSLQGYKKWKGAITYRLDQDWPIGIEKPPEDALKAGWYVDVVICPLGYYATGGSLTDGMPAGYENVQISNVKHGTWTDLVLSTEPYRETSRTFIVYPSTTDGIYDRIKVDWNDNKNFADDPEFKIWENMTSNITGLMGTYYWGYIDNWKNPTKCLLAWWCPLRERISDFSWWKEMGRQGYIHYGLHGFQHSRLGCPTEVEGSFAYWNGSRFIMNQTWIEQKFTEARDELAYCLGSTGYGFESDKVLVSQPGNEYKDEIDAALFNLDFVYVTYGDNAKNQPGWFLYNDRVNAMTCGGNVGRPHTQKGFEALKDAVKTLFPIFGIYEHNEGYYNLTFDVYPPNTAYTDMFCFAHLDESFEFWFNARYMWTNTINAYYKNNKIVLEYKANKTLKDYVWKFPIEYNGKYFNGFSDNRTLGKIKHIDGKYVYIEFSEGGNEKIEAIYGNNPHINQISKYVENIVQNYTPKKLQIQIWNTSGTINIKINCARLQQPSLIIANGTQINFICDPYEKICSFNISLNGLSIADVVWERAPPDSPEIVSPSPMKRFDPNESVTFTWKFKDPDTDDTQHAYRFQLSMSPEFTSIIIDTGKITTFIMQTDQKLPDTVGLYYWRVKTWDDQDAEGEWSDAQPVIVDRILISHKFATDNRTDMWSNVTVYFKVLREFDGALLDRTKGTVYINNMPGAWDETNNCWKMRISQNSVGKWSYKVSGITDNEHNITTINDIAGELKIIWDRLIITIVADSTSVPVNTVVNFSVKAIYEYDGKSVPQFTANILRNGTRFATNNFTDISNIPCTYQYAIENVKENNYGLTKFSSNTLIVTWTPKPLTYLLIEWLASNVLYIVMAIQFIAVIAFIFVKEKKVKKRTKLEKSF